MTDKIGSLALNCVSVSGILILLAGCFARSEKVWKLISFDHVMLISLALSVIGLALGVVAWKNPQGRMAVLAGAVITVGLFTLWSIGSASPGGPRHSVQRPESPSSARPRAVR